MDRTKGIGGSDANKIISGDWHELWLIKTKRKESDDLSDVVPVQIGIATESLNIDFLERASNKKVTREVELEQKGFMMSHLDGLIKEDNIVVECKHTNQNNTIENVASYYYPQLQHYMMHSGANEVYLSVFFGNVKYEYVSIESDYTFQNDLYKAEEKFWSYVQSDTEPTEFTELKDKIPTNIKLDGMTTIDMTKNLRWDEITKVIKETKPFVEKNKSAITDLKSLVPDDCRKAFGSGFSISRSKQNKLICREITTNE
jgi:hypothetical protein